MGISWPWKQNGQGQDKHSSDLRRRPCYHLFEQPAGCSYFSVVGPDKNLVTEKARKFVGTVQIVGVQQRFWFSGDGGYLWSSAAHRPSVLSADCCHSGLDGGQEGHYIDHSRYWGTPSKRRDLCIVSLTKRHHSQAAMVEGRPRVQS